jgi:hypothetical protein
LCPVRQRVKEMDAYRDDGDNMAVLLTAVAIIARA